jgi:putative tricarboxylic transport membrane protein
VLEGLYALGRSLQAFFSFWPIVYTLGATLVGVLVGCMPGLSATLAIALLTTLTIKLPPADAILILICAYVGTIYGGSRTAILLNIPGTAANAAACLDGYQLARQGRAGRAMGIATTGSVMGSLFGIVCLALLTPTLGEVALVRRRSSSSGSRCSA